LSEQFIEYKVADKTNPLKFPFFGKGLDFPSAAIKLWAGWGVPFVHPADV
jgi:hypothetical protein